MIEINGLMYQDLGGARFGPLRKGAYLGGPSEESDFCACARGQQALQWHREGLTVLPPMVVTSACECCERSSGLIIWKGWYTAEGSCLNLRFVAENPGAVTRVHTFPRPEAVVCLPETSTFEVVMTWDERPVEPLVDTKVRVTLFNAARFAVPADEPMEGGRWASREEPDAD